MNMSFNFQEIQQFQNSDLVKKQVPALNVKISF